MRHKLIPPALILSFATLASSAYAHHSHPYFYDECKPITIEGRVDTIEFKDPHTRIVLRLDDGTAYTVDWAPLSRLTNDGIIGLAKDTLVSGARVEVAGSRIRPMAQILAHFPDLQGEVDPNTVDPRVIRRVDDTFRWALPRRTNPPKCDGQ